MYLQITTLCNMRCPHCCARTHAGMPFEHMNLKTYRKALSLSLDYSGSVSLGGGEPTLHPDFWQFFGLALSAPYIESLWLATNGSKKETTLALAAIALESNVVGITLSQDAYHSPISDEVVAFFGTHKDSLETRDVTYDVIDTGFATDNQLGSTTDICACPETFIKPNGDIFMCGCEDALQIGTVWDFDSDIYDRANEVLNEWAREEGGSCGSLDNLSDELIEYIQFGGSLKEAAAG